MIVDVTSDHIDEFASTAVRIPGWPELGCAFDPLSAVESRRPETSVPPTPPPVGGTNSDQVPQ